MNMIVERNNEGQFSKMAGRSPAIGHDLPFNFMFFGAMKPLKRRDGAICPGLMAAMEGMICRESVPGTVCNCGHNVEAEAFCIEALQRKHKYF